VREKSGTPHLASHFLVTTKAIWRTSESGLWRGVNATINN
jgi:hypothetical protein